MQENEAADGPGLLFGAGNEIGIGNLDSDFDALYRHLPVLFYLRAPGVQRGCGIVQYKGTGWLSGY